MESKIKRALKKSHDEKKELTLTEAKRLSYMWNDEQCKPPLDERELERQWKADTISFVANLGKKKKQ